MMLSGLRPVAAPAARALRELAEYFDGKRARFPSKYSASSRSARAAGAATGRNPLSIIVPCHRIVGSDGGLTGYAGGLDRKRALLALESGAPD